MSPVSAAHCTVVARAASFVPRPCFQQLSRKARDAQVASNIGDDMMDFIQAGPKMRKWYGETDKLVMPKDGGPPEGDSEEEGEDLSGPRESIVVIGGDTELGELVVLQLILARSEIRVLAKDAVKTQKEFGPYVKVVQGDVNNGESLKKVMKGAKSVVVCGRLGQSVRAAGSLGVKHIVLPSALPPSGLSLGSLFGNPESSMQDESREADVMSGAVPYTVVRFEPLLDQIGGQCDIELSQKGNSDIEDGPGTRISREDAAIVIARSLANPPGPGEGAMFVAGAAARGEAPSKADWESKFAQLDKLALASVPKTA